jgi:hypothetical protein
MTCREMGAQLDLYLDGRREGPEADAVESHLAACPACASVLANRAALRLRVRNVARNVEIPADLGQRIRSSVSREGEKAYRLGVRFSSPFGKALMTVAAAGIAAAVLIATGGFYYGPSRGTPPARAETQAEFIARIWPQAPPVMRVGLRQHVHCGVYREYPEIPPKLTELAGEPGVSPALVNAVETHAPEGCHVVMAHRCTYNGRRFTHVVAKGDGRLMSLLITKRESGEAFESDLQAVATEVNTPIFGAGAAGFAMNGFETPEYLVYLVSDFDEAENLKAMKAMAPEVRAALL